MARGVARGGAGEQFPPPPFFQEKQKLVFLQKNSSVVAREAILCFLMKHMRRQMCAGKEKYGYIIIALNSRCPISSGHNLNIKPCTRDLISGA